MRIAIIPGSIGSNSYNIKMAKYIQERYKDKFNAEILYLKEIPMFSVDDELNPPEIIFKYRKIITESDGIIFVTPEYNHSIPGVLKNALDWFSRAEMVLNNKPGMIVGVSQGVLGTAKAQWHLRQILNSGGIKVITLPANEVFIGKAQDKFDEEGNFIHQPTIKFLDVVVDRFIQWTNKINN